MRGREVRSLASEVLPEVVRELTKAASLDLSDVDLIVPHQANGVMLEELAETLDLAPDVMHLTVQRYGNTGAASVPITLDDAVRNHRLSKDDMLFLVAFGGGMTWGGAALRWVEPRQREEWHW
jgi:3-oxoacyl-[acyl-carrier-protein] synthase-3